MIELILDECLEDILIRRATVAECLAKYADYAAELGPLLDTALAISQVTNVRPSYEFKAAMRARLTRLAAPPSPRMRKRLVEFLAPRRAS
ncbi:MAG: hypothetical protein HY782_18090 [Chloroflexi bacterium]|nr:hypothetical protein [Chloroflexota bacterium]